MIAKKLFDATEKLPCRLIKTAGNPYMERYWLGKFLGNYCYLHRFVGGDGERHLHDHPWPWALSIVLSGHYVEERAIASWPAPLCSGSALFAMISAMRVRDKKVSFMNLIRRKRNWRKGKSIDAHRIKVAEPETWTLFIHPEWSEGWGFYSSPFGIGGLYSSFNQYSSAERGADDLHWWKRHDCPTGETAGREPFAISDGVKS